MSPVPYEWSPATETAATAIRGQIASGDMSPRCIGGSLHVNEYRMIYGGDIYRAMIPSAKGEIDWTTMEFERGTVPQTPAPRPAPNYDEVAPWLLESYPHEPDKITWKTLGEVEVERLGDRLTHNRCLVDYQENGVRERIEDFIHGKTRYRRITNLATRKARWFQSFPVVEPDPRDGKPIESFESWMQESERTRRDLKSSAGRRFHACRRSGDMRAVIEALPMDHERRRELLNLNALLLRMVILQNDGGPLSESQLASF